MSVQILAGDCRAILPTLEAESVDCIVTSPPYYGLRDYGVAGQVGLEQTPEAYVQELVGIFRECRRVLKNSGTLWLNLGDSYANDGKWGGSSSGKHVAALHGDTNIGRGTTGLKPKDLIGIPWSVAFALRADGWYLRSDIIWSKPNPMPESVTDRPTKAHEYLFLLSKCQRYFYDGAAIEELAVYGENRATYAGGTERLRAANIVSGGLTPPDKGMERTTTETRNRRTVWEIATAPYSEAHFATFPPDLIEPCIKAGCPEKCCAKCGAPWLREVEKSVELVSGSGRSGRKPQGKHAGSEQAESGSYDIRMGPSVATKTIGFSPSCKCNAETVVRGRVLDPFGGAGTTGLVADRLQRNAILIELNPEYVEMAERRLRGDAPLFAVVQSGERASA